MANNTFLHEEIYRGKEAMEKLANAHITVCGAGTLGSNLIETLARQGFKGLRVIDMDRVEMHNINTQSYDKKDIGALKVAALKNKIFNITGAEIDAENKELKGNNAKKLFKKTDLVVDTFDNNKSRQLVVDQCRKDKIALLHAGLNGDYGEVVWDDRYTVPQDETEGDACEYPLARNLAMLVVSVTAEEVIRHFLGTTIGSHSITLKDLKVQPY